MTTAQQTPTPPPNLREIYSQFDEMDGGLFILNKPPSCQ